MNRFILTTIVVGMGIGLGLSACRSAVADDFQVRTVRGDDVEENWYDYDQPTSYRPEPRTIVQQKAQARAQQRQARLAAMHWYGMSNARPTAAATPFCSMYSPAWQMPGGRPFAWYTANRPVYVIYGR